MSRSTSFPVGSTSNVQNSSPQKGKMLDILEHNIPQYAMLSSYDDNSLMYITNLHRLYSPGAGQGRSNNYILKPDNKRRGQK
ncbi:hypothetical protein BLOT_016750 [Blomia tropicalis]|nr:hypothetical protein BLOT_016750 [Blomia tropicalis]